MPYPDPATLYEHATCGLLLTRPDGTIVIVNATFCNWVGFDKADLAGKLKLQDLLTIGSRIFHQTHWSPLLTMQGSIAEIRFDLKHRDGRPIPVLMNAAARSADGEHWHEISVTVAEDRIKYEREILKARKRAEVLLKTAEQMMGIVSHDLRNPLNTVLLGSTLLRKQALTDAQQVTVSRIARSGERASRMISDLLDFTTARLGSGLKLTVRQVDVRKFMSESVEELASALPGRSITSRCDVNGSLPFDADRIFQVISNLLSNASVYGDPGSPISVTARLNDGQFAISVHNTGPAIDQDLLPSLFLPMTRGTDVVGDVRSVGLGLFIVSEIAKAHGGDATVTSSLADGTRFTVSFPASPPVLPHAGN